MKNLNFLSSIALAIFLGNSFAAQAEPTQPTVRWEKLLGIQETIEPIKIEIGGVEANPKMPFEGPAIRLLVHGMSACGKNFLVQLENEILSFYQIGLLLPHIQPGCGEVLEYYWIPTLREPWDKIDQTIPVSLKIGPVFRYLKNENGEFVGKENTYFTLTTQVTVRKSPMTGYAFEYGEIRIQQPK